MCEMISQACPRKTWPHTLPLQVRACMLRVYAHMCSSRADAYSHMSMPVAVPAIVPHLAHTSSEAFPCERQIPGSWFCELAVVVCVTAMPGGLSCQLLHKCTGA